jgi:hypothetical protein
MKKINIIYSFKNLQRFIYIQKRTQEEETPSRGQDGVTAQGVKNLLFIFFFGITTSTGSGSLSLDTTSTATTKGRGQGEIDVLLGVQTNNERRNVDNLLTNADVTLTDQDASVMDGLGKTQLEDLGLETTLQEILNLETQDVIKLHVGFIKDTDTHKTTDQGVTFKETTGVLLIQLEELTSSTTDLGKGQTDSVDFLLVLETKLTNQLEFLVKTSSFEGTLGDLVGLAVSSRCASHLGRNSTEKRRNKIISQRFSFLIEKKKNSLMEKFFKSTFLIGFQDKPQIAKPLGREIVLGGLYRKKLY